MLQQFHIDAMVASNCYFEVTWKQLHQYPHLGLQAQPQFDWLSPARSTSSMISQFFVKFNAHTRSWAYWSTLYDTWAFLGNRSSFPNPFKWEVAEFLLREYVECNDIFCVAHSQIKPPKNDPKMFFFNTWPDLGFLQCPAYNLRTLLYVDPNLNPWFKSTLFKRDGYFSLHFDTFCSILCMMFIRQIFDIGNFPTRSQPLRPE